MQGQWDEEGKIRVGAIQIQDYGSRRQLTDNMVVKEFHNVGRGFPSTTSHSASTNRFLYLTSTVGNFTFTLKENYLGQFFEGQSMPIGKSKLVPIL